jgi:hypothetical protein
MVLDEQDIQMRENIKDPKDIYTIYREETHKVQHEAIQIAFHDRRATWKALKTMVLNTEEESSG